jgi:S-DNA-T family DNA segregation ATPase FtsK/SpoIIIE
VQQEQWQQPYQPPQPEYEPQHYEQPVAQPYQEYVPEPVEPVQPYVSRSLNLRCGRGETSRPPMYYFEEVEERRAREREQLAAWYQPVPEPVQEPVTKAPSVSVPPVDPTPAVAPVAESVKQATAAAAVLHLSLAWQQVAHRVLR